MSKDAIETVFNWAPDDNQWWITGFNPDFDEPDVHEMVSVGSVDFSKEIDGVDCESMYESLKNMKLKNDLLPKESQENKWDSLIFDDINKTVWIMWGKVI